MRSKVPYLTSIEPIHALELTKEQFPAAYKIYRDYCLTPDTARHKQLLVGTTLLIPPQEDDIERSGSYWIACPLTSIDYGRRADKPDKILENTRKALQDLRQKIRAKELAAGLDFEGKIYAVRINGKAFKTPWLRTRRVLEQCGLSIKVMNNVDVMDEKEKKLVLDQMKEWGFDVENVVKQKGVPESEVSDVEDGQADVQDKDGDDQPLSSEVKKRKSSEVKHGEQVENADAKKKRRKSHEKADEEDIKKDQKKKSKRHVGRDA